MRPFNALLRGPPALADAPNVNMLWAHLMVDELCRLGSSTFCIAPGMSFNPEIVPYSSHSGILRFQ